MTSPARPFTGSLLFLHGASADFQTTGELEVMLNQRLVPKYPGLRVEVPPWRQMTMPPVGNVELTFPKTTLQELAEAGIAPKLFGPLDRLWRAIKGAALETVLNKVADGVTDYFEDQRGLLMGYLQQQLLGEVLAYHLYRPRIQAYVREQLLRMPPPVVAGGLSLGGIVWVDFLSDPRNRDVVEQSQVRALTTIGSQAPILYAFGALEALTIEGVEGPFTPWINVFDKRDFLAFRAHPVFANDFGQQLEIVDVVTHSNLAYPASHSAYWEQDETWDALSNSLDRIYLPA